MEIADSIKNIDNSIREINPRNSICAAVVDVDYDDDDDGDDDDDE